MRGQAMADRCRRYGAGVTSSRAHLALAFVWALMVIPTLLWWRNSVLFVAGVSLYANVVSHLGAYQAARAEAAATSSAEE